MSVLDAHPDGQELDCRKCAEPVRVTSRLHRDGLILVALDPNVIRFGRLAGEDEPPAGAASPLYVERRDGFHVLHFGKARVADLCANSGLPVLHFTDEQIEIEPRRSNARAVWSCRRRHVPVSLKLQIMTALEDGPLCLGELMAGLRGDGDPAAAVFALACIGDVAIDLNNDRIGPRTAVWSLS